ncbi:hypothetical protein [Aeromicrobium sp. 179-A 4D2 NHS]|uniref:hypothetical protein n=1 Tax=Aeromicrobium sp. 179-A 4D2 NHS TaxID=3142375 RepID=UPI00399F65AA
MTKRDQRGSLHGNDGRYTEDQRSETSGERTLPQPADETQAYRDAVTSRVKEFVTDTESALASAQGHLSFVTTAAEVHTGSAATALSDFAEYKGEHSAYKTYERFITDETAGFTPEQALMETADKVGRYGGRSSSVVRNAVETATRDGWDRGMRNLSDIVRGARG